MAYEITKRLKNSRVLEVDGITGELLKEGCRILWCRIYDLILMISKNEKIPERNGKQRSYAQYTKRVQITMRKLQSNIPAKCNL